MPTPAPTPTSTGTDRYAAIRSLLDEERRALLRELDHPGLDDVNAAGDPGGRLEALEAHQRHQADLQRRLAELDDALSRIGDGSYGTCSECGAEIPVERLEALPMTHFCVSCAARQP